MSFKSFATAAAMRDAITEIVEEVVKRLRPEPRIAEVVDINSVNYTAEVKLAGDEGTMVVRFTPSMQPRTVGSIVRIQGKPGDYYISEVLNEVAVHEVYEETDAKADQALHVLEDPSSLNIGDSTLGELAEVVENVSETATSARNLASTADGRVSMSDYDPEPGDVLYYSTDRNGNLIKGASWSIVEASITSGIATLTFDTGLVMGVGELIIVEGLGLPFDGVWTVSSITPTTVSYRIASESDIPTGPVDGLGYNTIILSRTPGSVWFTRTRARLNYVTNPSFEIDTAGWDWSGATATREVAVSPPISGDHLLRVVNDATEGDHYVRWAGGAPGKPVEPGQTFAVTAFCLLESGVGTGCYASIKFFDAAGVEISKVVGAATELFVDDWQELKVSGTVPELATHMAAVILHNPNPNAVWHVDGALAEQAEYTGRYFDGNSYDGEWLGDPGASESRLLGNKIISVYELYDNGWVRLDFTGTTTYDADASDLTKGTLDPARLGDGSVSQTKILTNLVTASEVLTEGDIVNVWDNNGQFSLRRADASAGYEAHGFVLIGAIVGEAVPVYTSGYNNKCVDLSSGAQFLSSTAGEAAASPPLQTNYLIQRIGFASDSTTLHFMPGDPIKLVA